MRVVELEQILLRLERNLPSLGLVIIDPIQGLVADTHPAAALKRLAINLDVVVVATSCRCRTPGAMSRDLAWSISSVRPPRRKSTSCYCSTAALWTTPVLPDRDLVEIEVARQRGGATGAVLAVRHEPAPGRVHDWPAARDAGPWTTRKCTSRPTPDREMSARHVNRLP